MPRLQSKKGSRPLENFLKESPDLCKKILAQAQKPLKDAAAVNSTRWALYTQLKNLGLPVKVASGGKTKWNRFRLNIPKDHCLDALCVGDVSSVSGINKPTLVIRCTGRGLHQRTITDSSGFPRGHRLRTKRVHGFSTGDRVLANVPKGINQGTHVGRVIIRASGSFDIETAKKKIASVSWKYCRLLARGDGYSYTFETRN